MTDDWENCNINLIFPEIKYNCEDCEDCENTMNLSDEKKNLERNLIEDSDLLLSKDLFGTNSKKTHIKSIESSLFYQSLEELKNINIDNTDKNNINISLKTKKDHEFFAKMCIDKLKKSTPLHIKIFYHYLTEFITTTFTREELESIIIQFENTTSDKSNLGKNIKPVKNHDIKINVNKNHDDIFGKSENMDMYENIHGSIADKYLF
jgi:hypothetical protein